MLASWIELVGLKQERLELLLRSPSPSIYWWLALPVRVQTI